jgi:undecaprenol kinase
MVREEWNFRLQLCAGLLATALAGFLGFSLVEWAILTVTIVQVLIVEAVNAALERWVNLVKPDLHPLARDIKDIAAGAVLLSAGASVLIGVVLFVPKLWRLFAG